MKNYIVFGCLLMLISVWLACSSSSNLANNSGRPGDADKRAGIINEFFDPLVLDDEELKVKKTIISETKTNPLDEAIAQSSSNLQPAEVAAGFRVQICAVSEEDKARQVQRDAILKFTDEEVYLIYEAPYYKVRVGNCASRLEADQLQQIAIQKGFEDAWVVRTKIKLKSSSGPLPNTEQKSPNE
ncbi:MAG: SPOR domain-containing protein [candidate division KSB1 bacterium]|nr:SPOR domain-containing protein [candidate division KSB1 bacterium]MDZ7340385.1 SPOR domain-containing protein [candidate division KSB1 bacterium]